MTRMPQIYIYIYIYNISDPTSQPLLKNQMICFDGLYERYLVCFILLEKKYPLNM